VLSIERMQQRQVDSSPSTSSTIPLPTPSLDKKEDEEEEEKDMATSRHQHDRVGLSSLGDEKRYERNPDDVTDNTISELPFTWQQQPQYHQQQQHQQGSTCASSCMTLFMEKKKDPNNPQEQPSFIPRTRTSSTSLTTGTESANTTPGTPVPKKQHVVYSSVSPHHHHQQQQQQQPSSVSYHWPPCPTAVNSSDSSSRIHRSNDKNSGAGGAGTSGDDTTGGEGLVVDNHADHHANYSFPWTAAPQQQTGEETARSVTAAAAAAATATTAGGLVTPSSQLALLQMEERHEEERILEHQRQQQPHPQQQLQPDERQRHQLFTTSHHHHQHHHHMDSNLSLTEYFPEQDDDYNTIMTPSEAGDQSSSWFNSKQPNSRNSRGDYSLDTPPSCIGGSQGQPPTDLLLLPPPAVTPTSATDSSSVSHAGGEGGGDRGTDTTCTTAAITQRSDDKHGITSISNSNNNHHPCEQSTLSSVQSSVQSRAPVLYSAIGSLEDPSNGSFKWKNKVMRNKNTFDFPSNVVFLPPQNQIKQRHSNNHSNNIKNNDTTPGGAAKKKNRQHVLRGSSGTTTTTTTTTTSTTTTTRTSKTHLNTSPTTKENKAQDNIDDQQPQVRVGTLMTDRQQQQQQQEDTIHVKVMTASTRRPVEAREEEPQEEQNDDASDHNSATNSKAKKTPPPSSLRSGGSLLLRCDRNNNDKKTTTTTNHHRVKIAPAPIIDADNKKSTPRKKTKKRGDKKVLIKKPVEMFRPCSDAYTPRMGKKEIKYKPAEKRTRDVHQMASGMGTLSRPNFRDALRRVAMIIHQHIVKIEQRFESRIQHQHQQQQQQQQQGGTSNTGVHLTSGRAGAASRAGGGVGVDDNLFAWSMKEVFSEEVYATPTYRCTMVRVPMARPGMVYGMKKVRQRLEIPTEAEIYEFAHRLFKTVQLSSECSIVCLIYVERLMEVAKVPLLASTWRPIVMCGLLLASKVWQDLSSWNIEFATVYPQYSLAKIHLLECQFLRMVKWDLYISSSLYAKYYFALRSIVEKPDFRQRYNRMVGGVDSVQASEARKIEERSTLVKEEVLMQLSRSM
jgi:Cyclin, N-terminal domain